MTTGDGISLRDLAGGSFDIGFYTVAFVVGYAVSRRFRAT